MTAAHETGFHLPPEMGRRVPVLPRGTAHLIKALADEDIDFQDLVAEIELFPPIAARLLSVANSAWSSPVSPVTSLVMACSRLGLNVVRTVAMALAVAEPFNPAVCPPFQSRRYWSSALLTAEAACLVARASAYEDDQTARTAGLLRNIGLLWMADAMPGPTGAALQVAADNEAEDLETVLRDHCGIGYLEAGSLLAAYWQLPASFANDAYTECVAATEHADRLPGVICVGSRLSHRVRRETADADAEETSTRQEPNSPGFETVDMAGLLDRLRTQREQIEGLAEQLCG